ncbi:MAG: SpoIIE family protein phosphatase [Chloroflexi bacterium]|nr:SpoIIE family protein phosphatase [Chloroflexota bacterium]
MQLLRRTDEALARRVDELEKLRSSSLAVSSTLDLDAVLARILTDVQALFPGAEMTIWEYHPDQASLTVLQSSLADPVYRGQRLGMDSITGQAVMTRVPRTEPDLTALPGAAGAPIVRLGLHSMVAVPLISRDRAFGTINLYTYGLSGKPAEAAPAPPVADAAARAADLATHPIGPAETELLKAFAAHAAVAIDNARLHREEVARQRLEQELEVGRQIQLSMLPKCCPEAPGWQVVAYYQPARSVGGDFYDFYDLPGKPARLGLVIADVADHGVGAALFMALSRTIIRTVALAGRGPASALMRSNTLILKDSHADTFISAVYAALELETGRLIYANAGHTRPLWYHAATGAVTELALRGIVLGAFEEIQLKEERLNLEHGDALVSYTDGVTEAENAAGEPFGDERLRAVVAANGGASAEDLLRAVVEAVTGWAGGREWGDDVTGVVVKRG